ncbi:hypothetical protein IFM89_011195 [Coptis chinensis]|uniref:ABC transmembrane type-1 domain-containing protein n=1 Tax=Coptis chinensis TaxID=261450 RepID=A0A835LR06_9MAGN|nr:hypothetical protein IFM89_011195 [Coptis chinensis]
MEAFPFLQWINYGGYKRAMKSTGRDLDSVFRSWVLEGMEFPGYDHDTIIKATCQKYYMAYSREFVRIVSIQKSPVIHLFGESIAGATTIRGFGQEKRFVKRNLYLLDCFARPFFCNIAAIEWLCLRMELLLTFVFAFCMFLLVCYKESLHVVLHNVSCSFPGGKKIGIVGRIGSGSEEPFRLQPRLRRESKMTKREEGVRYRIGAFGFWCLLAIGDLFVGVCDSTCTSRSKEFGSQNFTLNLCASLGFFYLSEVIAVPFGIIFYVK